jgi:AcrR family transcriptional regulator
VRYTRQVIRESFLRILKGKPIQKITVTEICGRAQVNRATFYRHYRSPYDLLEQIQDDLYGEMTVKVIERMRQDVNALERQAFDLIRDNVDLCSILMSENGGRQFLGRVMSLSREKTLASWKARFPGASRTRMDYLFAFVMSGSVAVIEQWVRTGMKETPLELGEIADRLCQSWLRRAGSRGA